MVVCSRMNSGGGNFYSLASFFHSPPEMLINKVDRVKERDCERKGGRESVCERERERERKKERKRA